MKPILINIEPEFISEFENAVEYISEYPKSGVEVEPGVRRVLLERFEYSFIYFEHESSLEILAIAHMKREPKYWAKRK